MMLRLEQHYKNTLTEISKLINGLTVLIHEVEGGVEDLGGIGFGVLIYYLFLQNLTY